MWAFKPLWDKGLVYEGFGCCRTAGGARPRCRTSRRAWTTSTAIARTRRSPCASSWSANAGEGRVLAWTTTPWTLPSNLALAVGPDIEYAVVEEDGARYVLAESRASGPTRRELGRRRTRRHADGPRARRAPLRAAVPVLRRARERVPVLAADFVTTEDGTGVVHLAPASARTTRRLQRQRHRHRRPDRRRRPLHRRGRDMPGQARVRGQPPIIRDAQGARPRAAPRDLRPPVPALLAVANPLVYRAVS